MAEGARALCGVAIIRGLIPFPRAPPSQPNHLPKAPLSNTITFSVRIPTWECAGGHKHSDYSTYPHPLVSIFGFQFRVLGAVALVAFDPLKSTFEETLIWGQETGVPVLPLPLTGSLGVTSSQRVPHL